MATEVRTCRTCLGNKGELISIYNGDDNSIVEMLEYILGTQLEVTHGLPQNVCYECFNDISRCYSFKTKCYNSFQILRDLLDKRTKLPEAMQIKVEPEVNISHQFFEAENESQKTLDTSPQDLTIMEMGNISIKSEPTEVTPVFQNEMLTQQFELYEKEILPPVPIASGNNNQVEHDHEQTNSLDIHTVQYLIRELKEERDSVDQLLELEVNIRHCASCGAGFAQYTDFKEHVKKCKQSKTKKIVQRYPNKSKKHFCPYCVKVFPRPCRLKNHLRKHHQDILSSKPQEETRAPNKHTCQHCDLSFNLESTLKYHLTSHTREKQFKNLISSSKKKLNSTIQLINHTYPKRHKCTECYQEFEMSSLLKIHMLDHKVTHRYWCKFCKKQFLDELEFKTHSIVVHSDENPFKCKFCATGFNGEYHLTYHLRNYICRGKDLHV